MAATMRVRPAWATLAALVLILFTLPDAMAGHAQQPDRDRDGIPDVLDRCPDEPETFNKYMDEDGCPDSIATLFELARSNVDTFWKGEAPNLNLPYVPPRRVVTYTAPIDTPCGRAQPDNAFFCALDSSLYFDLGFLDRELSRGDFAPVVIVAHEWGHHIQFTMGWRDPLPIRHELQADCFAGAFALHADRQGFLDENDSEVAMTSLFRSGRTDVPWLAPGSHGSGGNRIDAFMWGFSHGAEACTESVFLRKGGGVVPMFENERYPDGRLTDKVPLSVGEFTLVDVSRATDFLREGMTDAIRGKYRARDGAILDHWIAALPSPDATIARFNAWSQSYRDKGHTVIGEADFVNPDGTVTGRWIRFSKPNGRELLLWLNYQIVLVADGPADRTFTFAKRHPL